MTDLIISAAILALYIAGCAAYYWRTTQLRHRRAWRAQRRRIMAYRATVARPPMPDNVYQLDPYSRKVS
jgi:hypothetical protein